MPAYLVRPKRMIRCQVVCIYNHYPAARIVLRGEEKIVALAEVMSAEELDQKRLDDKKAAMREQHAELIARWKNGMTCAEWQVANGWNIGQWSVISMLKRYDIIE